MSDLDTLIAESVDNQAKEAAAFFYNRFKFHFANMLDSSEFKALLESTQPTRKQQRRRPPALPAASTEAPKKRRKRGSASVDKVHTFLKENGPTSAADLAKKLRISVSHTHRQLLLLEEAKRIKKVREGLRVLYHAHRTGGRKKTETSAAA